MNTKGEGRKTNEIAHAKASRQTSTVVFGRSSEPLSGSKSMPSSRSLDNIDE